MMGGGGRKTIDFGGNIDPGKTCQIPGSQLRRALKQK